MIFANVKSVTIPQGTVASIFRGTELLWKKQKYKRKLLYLESTGTQYIDTGVIGKTGVKTFLDFEMITGDLADNIFFGSVPVKWNPRFYPATVKNGKWGLGYDDRLTSDIDAKIGQRYAITSEMVYGNQNMIIDGTTVVSGKNTTSVNTNLNMYLFCINWGGNAKHYGNTRVYACQIYENDNLVRDFIPVLDMNDIPCMYDQVNGEFFYNKGTGEFTYG